MSFRDSFPFLSIGRHKGTGQAFVQFNGHRYYLGKWDSPKSKERYSRFAAELAVSPIVAKPTTPASEITMVELVLPISTSLRATTGRTGSRPRTCHTQNRNQGSA